MSDINLSLEISALLEAVSWTAEISRTQVRSFSIGRALRLHAGWGQTEMARRLGLARRGYVSNLEGGRKAPSLELVVLIADLFEVSADYLLRDAISVNTDTAATENDLPTR